LDQALLTQAIDHLRRRGVHQGLPGAQAFVQLTNGGRAELPQFGEDCVFELIRGQTESGHG
jgi:hypothetical protein